MTVTSSVLRLTSVLVNSCTYPACPWLPPRRRTTDLRDLPWSVQSWRLGQASVHGLLPLTRRLLEPPGPATPSRFASPYVGPTREALWHKCG